MLRQMLADFTIRYDAGLTLTGIDCRIRSTQREFLWLQRQRRPGLPRNDFILQRRDIHDSFDYFHRKKPRIDISCEREAQRSGPPVPIIDARKTCSNDTNNHFVIGRHTTLFKSYVAYHIYWNIVIK